VNVAGRAAFPRPSSERSALAGREEAWVNNDAGDITASGSTTDDGRGLNRPVTRRQLDEFWPSRRITLFDGECRRAA
jgi:hypothetical protein